MLMLGGQSHNHGHQDGQPQHQFRVNFDVAELLNIHYLLGQVTAPPRMPRLWYRSQPYSIGIPFQVSKLSYLHSNQYINVTSNEGLLPTACKWTSTLFC